MRANHLSGPSPTSHERRLRRPLLALLASLLVWASIPSPGTAATYPTGTFTTTSAGGAQCPDGYSCSGFRVTCSGVKDPGEGHLAKRSPSGTPRGLVMFFTDAGGTTWTSQRDTARALLDELNAAGLELVQVRWTDPWLDSTPGEKVGPARLGCRPATVIKWVEANLYNGSSQPAGKCGFCLTGESGGASQISYALAFYGLDGIIDAAIPIAGPPHAALLKGCVADFRDYTWPAHSAKTMDNSYGFFGGGGPCETHDESYSSKWSADGVDTGGADYVHPSTRITFLLGTNDGTRSVQHALDYADKLKGAGSPSVTVNIVEGMTHSAWDNQVGVDAVRAAILGQASIPGTVPALPNGSGSGSGSGRGRPGRGGSSTPTPTPTETLEASPTPSETGLALPPGEDRAFPSWIFALGGGILAAGAAYWLLRRRAKPPGGPSEPGPTEPEPGLPAT